jgi:hypothetical protein
MRLILLIFFIGFFSISLSAQCAGRDILWKRIVYLRDSSSVPADQQLKELLSWQNDIKNCPDPYDSAYTLLLSRIGWLSSTVQKDFAKAVEYTRKSIDIIYAHAASPKINRNHLIKSYNNLRILYDSLKLPDKEAEATDSCISVALRLNTGFEFAIPLNYLRTQNLIEMGDYYRCISSAIIGENMIRANGYNVENVSLYEIGRINALIFLKKYEEAGELLTKAITEATKVRFNKYLGSLYGLMATIAEE